MPADYLNLATQRRHTVEETQDLINRHLLARGFTLLKSGGVLTVANAEGFSLWTVEGTADLTARDGTAGVWDVRYRMPLAALNEGVQSFVFAEAGAGTKLGDLTVVAGEPLDDDIRAEVALLRAELDMLKRAFRRYAREH